MRAVAPRHVSGLVSVSVTQNDQQYAGAGRFEFEEVLLAASRPFVVHCNLGDLFERKGDLNRAVEHYREGVKTQAPPPDIVDRLAWILATQEEDALRNGREALELATYAVQATQGAYPHLFEGLAAAQAETGAFDEALKSQERAIAGYGESVPEAAKQRLESYRARRPLRQARGRL